PSLQEVSSSKPRGRTAPERLSPSGIGPQGSSIYGAQRAQPVATGGKWPTPENGSNRPIGNRWQPTATVSQRMVRRGSTVRVRQRASQKGRMLGIDPFRRLDETLDPKRRPLGTTAPATPRS